MKWEINVVPLWYLNLDNFYMMLSETQPLDDPASYFNRHDNHEDGLRDLFFVFTW